MRRFMTSLIVSLIVAILVAEVGAQPAQPQTQTPKPAKKAKQKTKKTRTTFDQAEPAPPPAPIYVISQDKKGDLVLTEQKPLIINPYEVKVALDKRKIIKDGDPALAAEVAKVLAEKKPKNPGRATTFAFLLEEDCPYIWTGWTLNVREVEGEAGEWKAKISVFAHTKSKATLPQVHGMDGIPPPVPEPQKPYPMIITNRHTEIYKFSKGKLTLVSDTPDTSKGVQGF